MSLHPSKEEIEFLQELKEQYGINEMALALEDVLDIAAFESNGSTPPEVKQKMYMVRQLIKSLRAISVSSES
jgi:hypothetical protein